MSKVRIPINPMQVGRVGAYSMYVRSGEQIVRQRKNSSNYGPEASRTESQMTRRVKWSSLVNFYKVCSAWMPKAYETLKQGQTVYNKFMQLNINKAHCALTKDMAANGCCCIEDWTVSQGSLSPIELDPPIGDYGVRTNIVLESAINATTTVKSLSEDIIANNSTFQNGDNIAMVWFKNYFDSRTYPFAVCEYFEFTLDTANTALLNTTDAGEVIASGNLTNRTVLTTKSSAVEENGANAFVFIHTRKVGGLLKVSTQDIYVSVDDYTDPFTGAQAFQTAIDSYGITEEVPLDPSFNPATGVRVTYNGSQIWASGQGRVFIDATEGGELIIQGRNLNSEKSWVSFLPDGASQAVRYTPLWVDSSGWHYILSSNGNATVIINQMVVCGVELQGIVVPEGLTSSRILDQRSSTSTSGGIGVNVKYYTGLCINYPYMRDPSNQYFLLQVGVSVESIESNRVSYNNCAAAITPVVSSEKWRVPLTVTDATKPAWVSIDNVIVAVFNYS